MAIRINQEGALIVDQELSSGNVRINGEGALAVVRYQSATPYMAINGIGVLMVVPVGAEDEIVFIGT